MFKNLSIIIPAYNEEERIKDTVISYLRMFPDSEFIVSIDGSTDNTANIIKKIQKRYNNLKLIDVPFNVGKGFAVKRGWALASRDFVGYVDADNAIRAEEFKKIFLSLETNSVDGAVGSRDLEESVIEKTETITRRTMGKIFELIVNLFYRTGIKDTQCGAKVFRKNVIKEILPMLKSNSCFFDVELLSLLHKKNYKIIEVPIKWTNKEGSKIGLKTIIHMTYELFKIRLS